MKSYSLYEPPPTVFEGKNNLNYFYTYKLYSKIYANNMQYLFKKQGVDASQKNRLLLLVTK